jgi:hypothetical protein
LLAADPLARGNRIVREMDVGRVEVGDLPKSQLRGLDYLGVMRLTDLAQVLQLFGG